MTQDHGRLDAYLADADRGTSVERAPYEQFRVGLLRHIAIEEKVLFAAIRARPAAPAQSLLKVLHADHAALASLLVPSPTPALLRELRGVLDEHNPLEECAGGLYDLYEQLAGGDLAGLTARAAAIPPIRASTHVDGPRVDAHVARMLAERARVRSEAAGRCPP